MFVIHCITKMSVKPCIYEVLIHLQRFVTVLSLSHRQRMGEGAEERDSEKKKRGGD